MTWLIQFLAAVVVLSVSAGAAERPLFYYNRYFNAQGENRYTPEGTYSQVMGALARDFTIRTDNEPLSRESLRDVKVLLLSNVSKDAVGTNPPPHHISAQDVRLINDFVKRGGGLIFFSNQPEGGHNLEVENSNKLLAQFGIQQTNLVTDAKKLVISKDAPLIGGLRWAYYTGNLLLLDPKHPAHPEPVVTNDLKQGPAKGTRDQQGVLLARATPGKGRVVAITDGGSIANFALTEEGVGGVSIHGQDNLEMFLRLARWAAGGK